MAATRGTTELRRAGIDHRVLEYAYESGGAVAERAAEQVGVAPERVFKSLVAGAGDELVFALLPATAELSPKKLASAAGSKAARMADPRDAERATGYQIGGISPLGSKRRLRVFLDASASEHTDICLNAGRRGALVEIRTDDLVRLTGAVLADLSA
ncbi:MAG: Cys-tRNA(Pro)/Cys-tRNA(Cys) deacylase [Gaiellales bacterium]|jgi:Cys-tRNA(Pro)/Cys-tRNA(Cys) deacylase|nr:Cys-tRNA(Pro)/Cys-tRNA(Cys) deacylase [Gaiellales bacterium]